MERRSPTWFTTAVAQPGEVHTSRVEDVLISRRVWGTRGRPVVVLVHGGAAHAGWWDHVAPHLSVTHRVVAVELSGHGDSERRDHYETATWAAEVMDAAMHESPSDCPPVLVGHSLGGVVTLTAGSLFGTDLAGVVAIDTAIYGGPNGPGTPRSRRGSLRTYASRSEILQHFQTMPADDAGLSFVHEYIANGSIQEAAGGWQWKFDPAVFRRPLTCLADIPAAKCPTVLIRAERGFLTPAIADAMADRLGDTRIITILDSGHHVMIDQPVALVAALQALLAQWRSTADHSSPARRPIVKNPRRPREPTHAVGHPRPWQWWTR